MLANIIHFILMPIVWVPIVAVLGFLTYRNYRKINQLKVLNVDSVLLMLEIPRTNDKKELAAEQLFASLHGILRDKMELKNSGGVQEHLSFEIVSTASAMVVASVSTGSPFFASACIMYVTCGAARPTFSNSSY